MWPGPAMKLVAYCSLAEADEVLQCRPNDLVCVDVYDSALPRSNPR
jgi:hypothetical protein